MKTGPKPENGICRERLCGGGPFLRRDNRALLQTWRATYGVPMGRIIDALIDHCRHDRRFSMTTKHKLP